MTDYMRYFKKKRNKERERAAPCTSIKGNSRPADLCRKIKYEAGISILKPKKGDGDLCHGFKAVDLSQLGLIPPTHI